MVEEFRRELIHLRDKVLYLLDRLEIVEYGSSGGSKVKVEEVKPQGSYDKNIVAISNNRVFQMKRFVISNQNLNSPSGSLNSKGDFVF